LLNLLNPACKVLALLIQAHPKKRRREERGEKIFLFSPFSLTIYGVLLTKVYHRAVIVSFKTE